MAWLISLFTGSSGGYLLSAGVGALLAASVAVYATHEIDGITLSKSQVQTAAIDSAYSQYKATVAANTAKADADALAQRAAQDSAQSALEAKLLQAQQTSYANSQKLKDLLNHAAPQDVRVIGPVAGNYYSGLRQLQSAATASH